MIKLHIKENNNNEVFKIDGNPFKLITYYTYKSDGLYRNTAKGEIKDTQRPRRVTANFNFYADNFHNANLPYSTYIIADKNTGKVYEAEITHYGQLRELGKEIAMRMMNSNTVQELDDSNWIADKPVSDWNPLDF